MGCRLSATHAVCCSRFAYRKRKHPLAPAGRQISKRLARARGVGPLAYGMVLGTGVLTIISTPAVWLGLACCFAVGDPVWGAVYGVSFGVGRAAMLTHNTLKSRGISAAGVAMLVLGRQLDPRSKFWWCGVVGGLVLTGLAVTAVA